MKTKTFNEIKRTNKRLGKSIQDMDNHQRKLYGSNAYDYCLSLKKALTLYRNGEYEATSEILAIINIGVDIINTEIVMAGSHKVDSMTINAESNKPLTREILRSKYQVSDSFKGITLNSINDELPVRLSSRALSKLVKKVFPDVQERKCTNNVKYNLELI